LLPEVCFCKRKFHLLKAVPSVWRPPFLLVNQAGFRWVTISFACRVWNAFDDLRDFPLCFRSPPPVHIRKSFLNVGVSSRLFNQPPFREDGEVHDSGSPSPPPKSESPLFSIEGSSQANHFIPSAVCAVDRERPLRPPPQTSGSLGRAIPFLDLGPSQ